MDTIIAPNPAPHPSPSPQQRAAIEAPPGPVLVLAGPGAGKTFCLIERVRRLVSHLGADPGRVCAVTFTNRAAEEIVGRLHRDMGATGEPICRGTLHALCLDILRAHGERLRLRRGFGVADESYQRLALRRLGVARQRMGALLTLFGRRRLQGYTLTEGDQDLLDRYTAILRARNVVDFDELITLTRDLLAGFPDARAAIAGRWEHLLVDEFQDLNATQYEILKYLAAPHDSFFAVGDDEQSIFSWTGADPDVLRRFREDYRIAEPVVLDRNRRSSRLIFAAARRLVECNPQLFHKRIEAVRESPFPVLAQRFPDEELEAAWVIEDVLRDRAAHGIGWGDVAVLYRHHRLGEALERHFLRVGIPCRLARGRALSDDDIIGQIIASLWIIRDPDDPLALEALAERVLPAELLERIRAGAPAGDLLAEVRRLARDSHGSDPDTKKAWRFVFQVENLRALGQSHESLRSLVDELLMQRMGAFRNPLEDQSDELTDPADYPGAASLADRLAAGPRVWIVPHHGVEIALRGMLVRSGLVRAVAYLGPGDSPGPDDLVLRADPTDPGEIVVRLFKGLQLAHGRDFGELFRECVAFDLETTGNDVGSCEVIEIGAVLLRDGVVVDRFQTLVRPQQPVQAGAAAVHGYTDADLADQPSFAEVWPRFRAFVGERVLVAHNGHGFDVPVLRRLAAGLDGGATLTCFDTLPLARALFPDSAKLEHLADRFGVDKGRAHHALDDAMTLGRVLGHLMAHKLARARKAALVNLLDHFGLGLALAGDAESTEERQLLARLARRYALGRYSDCLEFYVAERERVPQTDAPDVEEVIERLGGRALMNRIRTERSAAERYPVSVARLEALLGASDPDAGGGLDAAIGRLLERVALSTSEGVEADPNRVNLLTLHSTKGLEFSRVYVVGVEDFQLPGYWAMREERREEIEESRRLLYVGMTRAQDRLVLTRAERRFGKDAGGSMFLTEIGVERDVASVSAPGNESTSPGDRSPSPPPA
jgi:DNA polymerase III epsilon subunit family exonuclease